MDDREFLGRFGGHPHAAASRAAVRLASRGVFLHGCCVVPVEQLRDIYSVRLSICKARGDATLLADLSLLCESLESCREKECRIWTLLDLEGQDIGIFEGIPSGKVLGVLATRVREGT